MLGHRQQFEKAADVVVLGGAVVAHERDERHVEHLLGLLPKRVSRAGLGSVVMEMRSPANDWISRSVLT